MTALPRPASDEHHEFYAGYVSEAAGDDVLALLAAQRPTITAVGDLTTQQATHRYAQGKWTVAEVLGHLADSERVFAYRALRFARADATDLPGFDENAWVPAARFGARPIADLAAELKAVREATIAFFASCDATAGARRGTANGSPCSVRAIAWIVAGHFAHHVAVLGDRYGVRLG